MNNYFLFHKIKMSRKLKFTLVKAKSESQNIPARMQT